MLTFDKPLSRSELARGLGVNRGTLRAWERSGRIPAADRVSGSRSEFSPAAQLIAASIVEAAQC